MSYLVSALFPPPGQETARRVAPATREVVGKAFGGGTR